MSLLLDDTKVLAPLFKSIQRRTTYLHMLLEMLVSAKGCTTEASRRSHGTSEDCVVEVLDNLVRVKIQGNAPQTKEVETERPAIVTPNKRNKVQRHSPEPWRSHAQTVCAFQIYKVTVTNDLVMTPAILSLCSSRVLC